MSAFSKYAARNRRDVLRLLGSLHSSTVSITCTTSIQLNSIQSCKVSESYFIDKYDISGSAGAYCDDKNDSENGNVMYCMYGMALCGT